MTLESVGQVLVCGRIEADISCFIVCNVFLLKDKHLLNIGSFPVKILALHFVKSFFLGHCFICYSTNCHCFVLFNVWERRGRVKTIKKLCNKHFVWPFCNWSGKTTPSEELGSSPLKQVLKLHA